MTICEVTGMACDCQPDEGIECIGEQTLKEGFHSWRNAALKAQARVRELEAALNRIAERTSSDDPCNWMVSLARQALVKEE